MLLVYSTYDLVFSHLDQTLFHFHTGVHIHTYHSRLIPEGVAEASTFYHNDLAMRNTADVTGGKPIAV
jgi:hypothetical protein